MADTQKQRIQLYNNKWTQVPLAKAGNYLVEADQEGSIIYISDNSQGSGALRVTKNFQIETSGRTTLYLKGQNEYDIRITKIEASLAGKADKSSTYTKDEVNQLLQGTVVAGKGVTYRGEVENEAALANVVDPQSGDLYRAKDSEIYYIYNGKTWDNIGNSVLSLTNYYTKAEVDVFLNSKANQSDYLILKAQVDGLLVNGNFNYTSDTEPPLVTAKEGETWFNPLQPMIYTCKKDGQNKLFWFSQADQMEILMSGDFVSKKVDDKVAGQLTFNALPVSPMTPVANNQLTTKTYVDTTINAEIKKNLTDKLVTIDTNQTITGVKTFTGTPKLNSQVLDPSDIANKDYVDKKVTEIVAAGGGGGGAPVDLSNYYTKSEADLRFADVNQPEQITGKYNFAAGATAIAPTIDLDIATKKYVDDEVKKAQTGAQVDLSDYAKKNEDNNFSVKQTFAKGATAIAPTIDLDVATKKYVDDSIVNVDTSTLAKLGEANTFTANNSFNEFVILGKAPTQQTHATTKKYVDDEVTRLEGEIAKVQAGGQIDLTGYAKKDGDNVFSGTNEFTKALKVANAAADTDAINQGQLNTELAKYVDLASDQEITAIKTFKEIPVIEKQPANDTDAANKKYVDDALGNVSIDTSKLVTIDTEQEITAKKTLTVIPQIKTPDTTLPTEDGDLITKKSLETKDIYSIVSRLAVKDDGSIVFTQDEYDALQGRDSNKIYAVEGELLTSSENKNVPPVAKSNADLWYFTLDEYNQLQTAGNLEDKFYFIAE